MKDPFERPGDRMVKVANVALPVLVDRLGGTVTVTAAELVALGERHGGAVGVKVDELEPGRYRLTLVPVAPRPERPAS
jgi:hypothetical protein